MLSSSLSVDRTIDRLGFYTELSDNILTRIMLNFYETSFQDRQ